MLPITKEILKATRYQKYSVPSGDTFNNAKSYGFQFLNVDKSEVLVGAADEADNFLYTITEAPRFGKIQFRFRNFHEDLTGPSANANTFTQRDVNEGIQTRL